MTNTTPTSGAVAKPFEDPAPPFNKWRGEMQAALKSSGIYAARSPGTGNKLTLRWRETRKAVQPAHQWDVGYPQLPEPDIAVCNDGKAWIFTNKDVVGEPYYTADQMRAFADATYALRASRGQAPARDLAAVIKGAADKLDAAVRCHPDAVDTLINEALEILDGDREPDATPASHGQAPAQPDQPIACSYGDNGYACCEGGPCQADVHNDKLAEQPAPAGAAPSAGAVAGPDDIDAIALTRYKVVPAHESMFHRFAVVAGGKQQLYLGREVECENMARKFAGAFLDGAFYQSQIAAAPEPAVTNAPRSLI